MKEIINYIFCLLLISPIIVLLLSDSILWILVGIAYTCCLYVGSVAFPNFWKKFVRTNIRICKSLGCW